MRFSEFAKGRDRLSDRSTVPVILSRDAAQRCTDADTEVGKAQTSLDVAQGIEDGRLSQPRVERAQRRLEQAEAEQEAAYQAAQQHLYEFTFESLSALEWDDLITDHPPTDEQNERLAGKGGRLKWNPDTFPVALITACLVEAVPVAGGDTLEFRDEDDVQALRGQVKPSVWDQLWFEAFGLNAGQDEVPSGSGGSVTTRSSGSA